MRPIGLGTLQKRKAVASRRGNSVNYSVKLYKETRNTFCGTRYLSHCDVIYNLQLCGPLLWAYSYYHGPLEPVRPAYN